MLRVALCAIALLVFGCGKKAPPEVKALLDAQRAAARKVADDAAKACPAAKAGAPFNPSPISAPPPPPNPARGTSLDSEPKVVDVFVMCSWPDPRDATGNGWGGTGLPSLRGTKQVPNKPVTMPDDMVENTCKKDPHDCEQVVVPSRYSTAPSSADLRITRHTSDGGEAQVTVVLVP